MMDRNKLTSLVERSRAGDRAAQEQLVAAVQNDVYFHCCKLLAHRENALDVTQEVLITMVTGLPQLQDPAAFRSWLLKIVYTRCKNHQMRGPKECQIPETDEGSSLLDLQAEDSPDAIPEQALDNAETVRILRELVDSLSADQRACVLLYYYDELKISEIASVLAVPESTVKNRLYHARRALKTGILRYEQHSGKLYTLSLAPLLGYLLRSEAEAGAVPATEQASLTASALSAGASTAGGTALWLKIAAGVAALGITVGGIWMVRDLRRTKPPVEIMEETSVPFTAADAFSPEDLAVLQDYLEEQCMVDDGLALTDCNGDGRWELLYCGIRYAGGYYQENLALLTVENGAVVRQDLEIPMGSSDMASGRSHLVAVDRETGHSVIGWIVGAPDLNSEMTLNLVSLDDAWVPGTPEEWTGTAGELADRMGRELGGSVVVLDWYGDGPSYETLKAAFPARTVAENLDLLQYPRETITFWGGDLVLAAPSFWLEDVDYAEGRDAATDWPDVTFWSSANRLEGDDIYGYLMSLKQTPYVSHTLSQWSLGPGGTVVGSLRGHAVILDEPTDYRARDAAEQYRQDSAVGLAVCAQIAWEPENVTPEDASVFSQDYASYVIMDMEYALRDHSLTFASPRDLTDDVLMDLAARWVQDRTLGGTIDHWDYNDDATQSYDLPEDVIRLALDQHLRDYDFDITRCSGYDPRTKMVHWEPLPDDGTVFDWRLVSTETSGNMAWYTVEVQVTREDETIFSGRKVYEVEYAADGWLYHSMTLADGEMTALTDTLAQVTGVSSNDPMTQFYHYYNADAHRRELSMLPELDGTGADWDDLTLYIYINAPRQSDGTLTRQDFADTVEHLLGDFPYEDRSSRYLTYESGVYRPVPGDSMWSGYYRLTDLSVDDGGVYTAAFDVLIFDETAYSDPYEALIPHMKDIQDTPGAMWQESMDHEELLDTILEIFWYDDYDEVFEMTEHVEIRFRLSGDPDYPLTYLRCTSDPDYRTMY